MKEEVPVENANRLVNTGCVVLVSSSSEDKDNIVTLAWQSPVSHNPMLLGVAIANVHLSTELINESEEFVINVPNKDLVEETHACGSISGREVDKFEQNNLSKEESVKIKTPAIKECIANIECKVENTVITGDHTLFAGKVQYAKVEEELFNFDKNCWKIKPRAELLHHLGSNLYVSPKELTKA